MYTHIRNKEISHHREGINTMMQREFEEIAGYEVTAETYDKIIEPMYMSTNLSKTEFVKLLNRKALEKKVERKPNIKKMLVRDHSEHRTTPNGCYYHIQYVDLVGVDIRTGKRIIKELSEEVLSELYHSGHSLDCGYDYDFDYLDAVDTKKKPIELTWSF